MLLAVGGILLHRDYGISWDEPQQRKIGHASLRYLSGLRRGDAEAASHLQDFQDRDYGVVFELPAAALEVILRLHDTQQIYWNRHLLTFFVSLLGIAAVYLLTARIASSRWVGVAAAGVMLLHPRIFADAFYNSKDSVFMSMFAVGLYAIVRFLDDPKHLNAGLAGVAIGLAAGVRVVGVGLLPLLLLVLGLSVLLAERTLREALSGFALVLGSSTAVLVASWPYLWASPVVNFWAAVRNMAQFRWLGTNLYFGEFVPAAELPWHYTPVWMLITTPIFIIVLFAVGAAALVRRMLHSRRVWVDAASRAEFIVLLALIGPVAGTAALGSVLYDGWRQHYFVFPAVAVLAARGLQVTVNRYVTGNRRLAAAFLATVAISAFFTTAWMVQVHPLQNVYFNAAVPRDARGFFEVDYWGLANHQALVFVLESDPRATVTIAAASATPLEYSRLILTPELRSRLVVVKHIEDADYVLTNYRSVDSPVEQDMELGSLGPLHYRLMAGRHTVLSVYRID